jgi:hypothetical protein
MVDRLRIGILCDGTVFKRWEAECLRQVLAVRGVEPVVLIIRDIEPEAGPKRPFKHAIHRWLERDLLRVQALAPTDITDELEHLPRLRYRPAGPSTGPSSAAPELQAVRDHAPDVLLRFGPRVPPGDMLSLARYGVWGYHHGDEDHYRGSPAAFWEIFHGDPVTGASLQRLTTKTDAGHILRKGWFRTIPHSWSANLDMVLNGSVGWMAEVCREILAGNDQAGIGTPSPSEAPVRQVPGNWDALGYLLRHIGSTSDQQGRQHAPQDEWNIGVLYQPIGALLEPKPSLNVRWLPAPGQGQYRQGPCGYMADGQLNVLYGKFDTRTGKSEISRLRPKRDNVLKRSRTMLAGEHALSHPFSVRHDGRWFVVPESASGRVDLYEVDTANEALDLVCTLLDVPLCSPTVFQHDGRWWLMGTRAPWEDVALHAYHAPSLTGPWTPHARDPLKVDVRSARPAGTPFIHNGQLYRPAMDNRLSHGGRIALMRVEELSPTAFREELVRTIGPIKGSAWSHGTGTISAVGDLTLVDGKRPMPGRSAPAAKNRGQRSTTKGSAHVDLQDEDDED